jgi:hypothetical protein
VFPWAVLVGRIAAVLESGSLTGISVMAGPVATVTPDAIVIRPEEPWVSRGTDGKPARFGPARLERYAALLAVRAADPVSAMERLYGMAAAVMEAASDAGFDWTQTSSITLDETTGAPLLVASVGITFSG